jgi:site-specific DNA recombinase
MSRPITKRCAIYTRKSSEEGLEQDFNSLAAQREACEAYIASQKSEGWESLPDLYDDGGFSGGTLDRPALQQLLNAIDAGRIDVVVVYKVDRLTRSLTDFAKLIERFDAHGVSVVAVTQPFNTTTSIGRLTLNVLLSFAQFEREITGERIRDKIAASKQKGMWMGGVVPLGYDLGERVLIVNDGDAHTVRLIFDRYRELGAVRLLQDSLDRDAIRTKRRISRNGNVTGGKPFSRGALYAILRNRLYLGEITHQGKSYPGQHEAIVSRELFDAVQAQLDARGPQITRSGSPLKSVLVGKVFDADGHRLSPSHARKGGRRYRYYVSQAVMYGGQSKTRARWPAEALEAFIRAAVADRIRDPAARLVGSKQNTVRLHDAAARLADRVAKADVGVRVLQALLRSAVLQDDQCALTLDETALRSELALPDDIQTQAAWTVPLTVRTCHNGQKRIVGMESAPEPDSRLITALIKAHQWYWALLDGQVQTIAAIAREAGRDARYIKRSLTLVYLAPDLKQAILDGRQPPEMTLQALTKTERLPIGFDEQRRRWRTDGTA